MQVQFKDEKKQGRMKRLYVNNTFLVCFNLIEREICEQAS